MGSKGGLVFTYKPLGGIVSEILTNWGFFMSEPKDPKLPEHFFDGSIKEHIKLEYKNSIIQAKKLTWVATAIHKFLDRYQMKILPGVVNPLKQRIGTMNTDAKIAESVTDQMRVEAQAYGLDLESPLTWATNYADEDNKFNLNDDETEEGNQPQG